MVRIIKFGRPTEPNKGARPQAGPLRKNVARTPPRGIVVKDGDKPPLNNIYVLRVFFRIQTSAPYHFLSWSFTVGPLVLQSNIEKSKK